MPSLPRRILAATGLLRPAFRLRERLRALEGDEPPALGPDGLPLPRRIHMVRVVGHGHWRQFYETGADNAATYAAIAADAGRPLSQAQVLLDWGCGCGRITRHLATHTQARIVGRDIDPMTIAWSAANLPGDFRVSSLTPPLDLADASVDAIIAQSVFTHLNRSAQELWLRELARILRSGGLLLVSFMDEHHHRVDHLGAARADLRENGFAVTTTALEGTNHMATFQTREQLDVSAAPWFTPAAYRSSRDTTLAQAVLALVRRP